MSNMKKSLLILTMIICTSAVGKVSEKTEEEKVEDLGRNYFQGIFSDFDSAALYAYCTSDFLLLETGEVWNMRKMRNYVQKARDHQNKV